MKTASSSKTRTIEREIAINAPVDIVWRAITEAEELARWFPIEAESRPGHGGLIRLCWAPGKYWEMPILDWQPNKRLLLGDSGEFGTEGYAGLKQSEGLPQLCVDYQLESRGATTVLRLVHSGFSADSTWDDAYEGTSGGWSCELESLRHYLEHHRGEMRFMHRAPRAISISRQEAWNRLTGPNGIKLKPTLPKPGARYSAFIRGLGDVSGSVRYATPPTAFVGTLDQLNNALFRIHVYPACGSSNGPLEADFVLSQWGRSSFGRERLSQIFSGALQSALGEPHS